jgi:AraC-like DNA-binding protein
VVHGDSIPDAIRVVRERPVDAVLVSVHGCSSAESRQLDQLVRAFPGIPTVALVSRHEPHDSEALLHFGASGVRQVVDVTAPDGWQRLRQVLGQPTSRDAARIQGPVLEALGEIPADARLFFEVMIRFAQDLATARDLSQRLGLCPTTLTSRFARVGLPSPKSHLAATRLLCAVLLFERPGFTVADVAYRLDYSSPQSFGRHVRSLLGITGTELRRRFTFSVTLERYLASLILPYRDIWSEFHPLGRGGRLKS